MNVTKKNDREERNWLTPAEAGERVPGGVSDTTIRSWCHADRIPGAIQTPTGRWKIPASAIEDLFRGF